MNNALKKILGFYHHENLGVKTNLVRFLNHGYLKGSGRFSVLAVDQGFEHGPGRSFSMAPKAYDPDYFYQLALKVRLSAFAAPLGLLESVPSSFVGSIPTILKINSGNTLYSSDNPPCQALTASVDDALRLGCIGVGFTLYFGSDASLGMIEEFREVASEARQKGLLVFAWSYPRGHLSKAGETALDVVSYGAHMAALLGAHIIKVKIPKPLIELPESKASYQSIPLEPLTQRLKHVVDSCFNGKRLIGFSGGEKKDDHLLLEESKAIYEAGGNGIFIGRNAFQRPFDEAVSLLLNLQSILLKGKE